MISNKPGVGLVYGKCEMDAETANRFAKWLSEKNSFKGLPLSRYEAPWTEFNVVWEELEKAPCFQCLQEKFLRESVA